MNNIRTVIEYADAPPYQNSTLDALAAVLNPAQTLLYLVDWRTNRYDVGYPDYNWDPSVPSFITHAHTLGFHVMLHTDALGVSPSSPDFAAVQQYQIKDALTLSPQGWNWNLPASTPNRYAIVNPAAPAWRQLFVARVTPAVQTLQADAIHLDFSAAFNDGNGLISGINSNQGFAQLEQDLLTAFPGLVLGIEENFDAIAPRASFSQPLYWSSSGLSPAEAQVNGVSSLLFTINATPALPAIYALPNADGSVFYVTAALAGTANLVGTSSVDARVLRAAQPGDTLDFYVIGLGATQDPTKFITSQIFAAAYPISAPLTLNVGGENVPVLFGGLVTPGLYLVRATIPTDLPAGAAPIQISLNGAQTTSALRLTIQPAPQGSLREDR